MSKKIKIIIGVVLVAVILVISGGIYVLNTGGSAQFHINSIVLKRAGKGSGGNIGVTVKEGEKLVIKSYLEKGSVKINLGKEKKAQTGEETIGELFDLMNGKDIEQIVEGYNTYEFEVPEGRYYGMGYILEDKTTGKVTLTSESK